MSKAHCWLLNLTSYTVKSDHRNMQKENFIPGVYNYCDRWCERCHLAMRCRVYDGISDENGNIVELSMEETLKEVARDFAKTFEMLQQWADEEGIDLEEASKASEAYAKKQITIEENVDKHPLASASWDYTAKMQQWMEETRPFLLGNIDSFKQQIEMDIAPEEQVDKTLKIKNALEILQYYTYPIHVKTKRALDGLFFDDEDMDIWEDNIQTDYNGSAKVALLEIDRSLMAFEMLRQIFPDELDNCLPLMAQLQKLHKGLESTFPNARKFVRPGFDTAE